MITARARARTAACLTRTQKSILAVARARNVCRTMRSILVTAERFTGVDAFSMDQLDPAPICYAGGQIVVVAHHSLDRRLN